MSASQSVVTARGLRKSFARKLAVDGVDLDIAGGEIVGFLGPNGAGKTTVMNMIAGLIRPDAGELTLFGVVRGTAQPRLRSRMGFLQEKPRIYPEMSGRAYLALFASLYGIDRPAARIAEAIDAMSLDHAAGRAIATYSRGMQQRLCLARAMLHRPEFLLLDEPTLGLDPAGVSEMRDTLTGLNRTGVALLFSSHQLSEMERICDRVILMDHGRVIATGTKENLVSRMPGALQVDVELESAMSSIAPALGALPFVSGVSEAGERVLRVAVASRGDDTDLLAFRAAIARAATAAGGTVLSVAARSPTLEEAFLQMTRSTRH